MDDPLRGEIVERLAVAGAGAGRVGRFGDRRRPAAGRAAPRRPADCRRCRAGCVCRPLQISVVQSAGRAGAVEHGAHRRHHRRADRLEAEFLLAPPAHPDRHARPAHRDDRGIGRRVVGAVMAVAARPLRVMHDDRGRIELQASGPARRAADRRPANASTPRACRRDTRRCRRTARSRHAAMCIRVKVASRRVPPGAGSAGGAPTSRSSEGCCNSQRASSWNGLIGSTPSQATCAGATAATASTTVSSAPRIATKLPSRTISIGPFGGAADRGLVDRRDRRAAARLAHDAGMHHAVERHVVDESRLAEHFGGEIDARRVLPDDAVFARPS